MRVNCASDSGRAFVQSGAQSGAGFQVNCHLFPSPLVFSAMHHPRSCLERVTDG